MVDQTAHCCIAKVGTRTTKAHLITHLGNITAVTGQLKEILKDLTAIAVKKRCFTVLQLQFEIKIYQFFKRNSQIVVAFNKQLWLIEENNV